MSLITFQNLPNTSTPLNAENLNNNFGKHILSGELSSNYTITTSGSYEKITLTQSVKVGTNLEINNGGIKCLEAGYIKISAKLSFNTCYAGVKWLTIYKNTASVLAYPFNTSTARISMSIPSTLISVSANDIIYMQVNGTADDVVRGGQAYTEMTVEYV